MLIPSIAVIFTCYNRKEKTLCCMKSIYTEENKSKYNLHFYICDDGSTDGTYEELKTLYPEHTVFQSKGNLFWCKGMHAAMKLAVQDDPDFYLMINDDVEFKTNVIDELFNVYNRTDGDCSIVGEIKSKDTGEITYGGSCISSRKFLIFRLCYNKKWFAQLDANKLVTCDLSNWNCFFVPRSIINTVGIIDGKYQHAYGDYDYSFRMAKKGKKQYITQQIVGYCENNTKVGSYFDSNTPRRIRFKKMLSRKGMPLYSHYRFHWRNFGVVGILQVTWSYIKNTVKILKKEDI